VHQELKMGTRQERSMSWLAACRSWCRP